MVRLSKLSSDCASKHVMSTCICACTLCQMMNMSLVHARTVAWRGPGEGQDHALKHRSQARVSSLLLDAG